MIGDTNQLQALTSNQRLSVTHFLEQKNRQLLYRMLYMTAMSFVPICILWFIVGLQTGNTIAYILAITTGITVIIQGIMLVIRKQLTNELLALLNSWASFIVCFVLSLIFPELDFLITLISPLTLLVIASNTRRWIAIVSLVVCLICNVITYFHPLDSSWQFLLGNLQFPIKIIGAFSILLLTWLIYGQMSQLQHQALQLAKEQVEQTEIAQQQAKAAQEELEQFQQAEQERLHKVIETLEIPLLPVGNQALVVPLVGDMDIRRADTIQQRLLKVVSQQRIRTVVIDVTSLASLDKEVATQLMRISRAVQLLGARVVISGISAQLAQTLVAIDMKFDHIDTPGNLGQALASIAANNN